MQSFPLFPFSRATSLADHNRLTAAKEDGAAIEIGGKKVALGIPGAKAPAKGSADPKSYPLIPLARPGSAEEAAGAVLLYVLISDWE